MMVGLKRISTALGLLAAMASAALAQGVALNQNQVDRRRRGRHAASEPNLAGYRIEIQARDGLVTLTGALGSPLRKPRRWPARSMSPACAASSINFRSRTIAAVRTVQYQPNPASTSPIRRRLPAIGRWQRRRSTAAM